MESQEENEVMRQQTCMEEEEESHNSLSTSNPIDFYPLIKRRRRSPLKIKKRLIPKMPLSPKPIDKPVISDNSRKSVSRKRTKIDDLYGNAEAKFSVMERAEGTLANLDTDIPSFVKCMLPSNVSHGFWLFLPQKFCKFHLPQHDTTVILVDECGEEYKTNYLVGRHGLSAGWRRFSMDHRLLKGDRLVFYLVGPCKLKVNIVRVYGLDEVDAALSLMNIISCAKRTNPHKDVGTKKKAKKRPSLLLLDKPQEDIQIQCGNYSDDFGSEVLEGSEVSDHLQANEWSCSQNSFQQDHHLKDINYIFAAGKVS